MSWVVYIGASFEIPMPIMAFLVVYSIYSGIIYYYYYFATPKKGIRDTEIPCRNFLQIPGSLLTIAYCIMNEDPYFFIINPFAAENKDEKWADTPRFPDPSLFLQ